MTLHNWKSVLLGFAFLGLTSSVTPPALADEWNKETVVTFSAPVEAAGSVLPAGGYIFELADTSANRTIVQIFTADHSKALATILATPAYRPQATGEAVITLEERSAKSPEAIRDWFYAGENEGVEFLYRQASSPEAAH